MNFLAIIIFKAKASNAITSVVAKLIVDIVNWNISDDIAKAIVSDHITENNAQLQLVSFAKAAIVDIHGM